MITAFQTYFRTFFLMNHSVIHIVQNIYYVQARNFYYCNDHPFIFKRFAKFLKYISRKLFLVSFQKKLICIYFLIRYACLLMTPSCEREIHLNYHFSQTLSVLSIDSIYHPLIKKSTIPTKLTNQIEKNCYWLYWTILNLKNLSEKKIL